jgi:hypothetical protein
VNYAEFDIGFWHPFGPHGGETPEDIIERKRAEIAAVEKLPFRLLSLRKLTAPKRPKPRTETPKGH